MYIHVCSCGFVTQLLCEVNSAQCQTVMTCVLQWLECKAVVMLCSQTSLTGTFKPVVNMQLPTPLQQVATFCNQSYNVM